MPPLDVPDPPEAVPELPVLPLPSGIAPAPGVSVPGVSVPGVSVPEGSPEPSGSSASSGSLAGLFPWVVPGVTGSWGSVMPGLPSPGSLSLLKSLSP